MHKLYVSKHSLLYHWVRMLLKFPRSQVSFAQVQWHNTILKTTILHSYPVATSSCRGHVDELLLHREHGTSYRRSWNCCDWRTHFVVIWRHFCFILSTAPGYRLTLMHPPSSSRGCNTSASVTVTVLMSPLFPCTGISGNHTTALPHYPKSMRSRRWKGLADETRRTQHKANLILLTRQNDVSSNAK